MKIPSDDPINKFVEIESAAHEGAFGDNPLSTPTTGQLIAGNYKKGRCSLYGIPIAIENPRNSYREGVDSKEKPWRNRMAAHYGYFPGTKGNDGDAIDCFVGFYPQAESVYIINQRLGGKFDEHKVMIGFPDEASARFAYLNSYERGWTGLDGGLATATISQFKWWLKNGNHTRPLFPKQLPFDGQENMKRTFWNSSVLPENISLDSLIYDIRRDDNAGLMLDSVCMADIIEGSEEVMAFDAMVTPYAKLEQKMNILKKVMDRMSATVKVIGIQISDPFKQLGTAQVAVIFELSDGQTLTVFFHNPDVTPGKIMPTDELVSWKWLLNKKDITIVVAPEKGQDLNVRDVGMRIMKLAEKNSALFQRANAKRTERMANIQAKKYQIVVLEKTLADKQGELQVALLERDERALNPAKPVIEGALPADMTFEQFKAEYESLLSSMNKYTPDQAGSNIYAGKMADLVDKHPEYEKRLDEENDKSASAVSDDPDKDYATSPEGYAEIMADLKLQEQYQDVLDKFINYRYMDIHKALTELGWDHRILSADKKDDGLFKNGKKLDVKFIAAPGGLNYVGLILNGITDDLTKTPEQLAAEIDDKAMQESQPSQVSDAEKNMREIWTEQGISTERQDELIAQVSMKSAPGAKVGPFTIPENENVAELIPDGLDNEVKTAKGTKVVTGFMVVEASKLIISHDEQGNANPDYPAELQPRDRARDTSQLQIAKIANNLDPDMLGRTRVAYQGAPIVGKDGVVESGNGRAMAITLAYKLGKADDYRAWLLEVADMYGLNKDVIEAIKNPILVRVRKTELDRVQFAMESNQSDMLAMTGTEKAKSDAARLTDAIISKLSIDGDLTAVSNRDFITAFLQALGDDETAGLLTTSGQPTKQLYDRAQAAIFAKAYNDDRLLELMADDSKPEIGNIIKSLNQAARPFIRARAISDKVTHDTTQKIGDAVELSLDQQAVDAIVKATEMLKKAKDSGMPIEELVKQGDLFGDTDPVVAQMALFIKDNNRSAARMGVAFEEMANFVLAELEHRQNDSLFVDDPLINMVDVLKAANAQLQKQYGSDVKDIGSGTGGFIDVFTETRGQAKDREAFLQGQDAVLPADGGNVEQSPIELVNSAYLFANASDAFKEWVAESLTKPDYSPFVTAKAMDEAALRNGASIEWGFFGGTPDEDIAMDDATTVDINQFKEGDHVVNIDTNYDMTVTHQKGYKVFMLGSNAWVHANKLKYASGKKVEKTAINPLLLDDVNQDGYVGKISKEGTIVGRVDIGGDGKAMVYVGEEGDKRVEYEPGKEAMYSDDDAPDMVDWLFNGFHNPELIPAQTTEEETLQEPLEILPVVDPIIEDTVIPVDVPAPAVSAGNPEIEAQKHKLQNLVDLQARMKAVNKILKNKKLDAEGQKSALIAAGFNAEVAMVGKADFAGRMGYADYQLTNNNATIRNTQKRILELESREMAASKVESGDRETSYDFDGGTIDLDYADDRLRVNFDSKPDSAMIAKLKSNGFKWSPTNTAWQRQLTDNAIHTANYMFDTKIQTAASVMKAEANAPRAGIVPAPGPVPVDEPVTNPAQETDMTADKIAAYTAELDLLESETDIEAFDQRLDEIVARIEADDLMEAMDGKLNATADVLTFLLAEAEKKAA